MNFADKISKRIEETGSVLIAGIDPRPDTIPKVFIEEADSATTTTAEFISSCLVGFYSFALEALHDHVAAVKPNSAFFEQYGIAGLEALQAIMKKAKELGLPVILDAKRGDIGSTAKAYSTSALGKPDFLGRETVAFSADALTVNPFLGFDTLEPLIEDCKENGRGIFVLVKTSNPGSGDIQNISDGTRTISERIADWIGERAGELTGNSGLSSLGAVLGATYPEEARELRKRMPNSYFLIPGMGAQGGKAEDAIAGFTAEGTGGLINVSRGLTSAFSSTLLSKAEIQAELTAKAFEFNGAVREALS